METTTKKLSRKLLNLLDTNPNTPDRREESQVTRPNNNLDNYMLEIIESMDQHSIIHSNRTDKNKIKTFEIIVPITRILLYLPSDHECEKKYTCVEYNQNIGYRTCYGLVLKYSITKRAMLEKLIRDNLANNNPEIIPYLSKIIIRTANSFQTLVSKHYGFFVKIDTTSKLGRCGECYDHDSDYYSGRGEDCSTNNNNIRSHQDQIDDDDCINGFLPLGLHWDLPKNSTKECFDSEDYLRNLNKNILTIPKIQAKKNALMKSIGPMQSVRLGLLPIYGYSQYLRDTKEYENEINARSFVQMKPSGQIYGLKKWNVIFQYDINVKRTHWWIWSTQHSSGKTGWGQLLKKTFGAVFAPTDDMWFEDVTTTTPIIICDEFNGGKYLTEAVLNVMCDGFFQFNRKSRSPITLDRKPIVIVLSNYPLRHFFKPTAEGVSFIGARFVEYRISPDVQFSEDQEVMRAIPMNEILTPASHKMNEEVPSDYFMTPSKSVRGMSEEKIDYNASLQRQTMKKKVSENKEEEEEHQQQQQPEQFTGIALQQLFEDIFRRLKILPSSNQSPQISQMIQEGQRNIDQEVIFKPELSSSARQKSYSNESYRLPPARSIQSWKSSNQYEERKSMTQIPCQQKSEKIPRSQEMIQEFQPFPCAKCEIMILEPSMLWEDKRCVDCSMCSKMS